MKMFWTWITHNPDNIFYKIWIDAAKEGSDKTVYYTRDGTHVSEIAPWPDDKEVTVGLPDSK